MRKRCLGVGTGIMAALIGLGCGVGPLQRSIRLGEDPAGSQIQANKAPANAGPIKAPILDAAGLQRLQEHPSVTQQAADMLRHGRRTLQTSLQRSITFLPMIEREFGLRGVPLALAYLPVIESHFRADAVGRATGGLWQFTAGTARLYGLTVNGRVDERRDPTKSSRAAARLLRDLHDQFGSWGLALAAYNAGSARVQQALARRPRANFFELAERRLLPSSTLNYVPKVLAISLIGSRPKRYGLEV